MPRILTVLLVLSLSPAAFAYQLNADGFAIDDQGSIVITNQNEAITICRDLGARLPTGRDLAEYTVTQGAKPLLDPANYPDPFKVPNFYVLAHLANANGTTDSFYFDFHGYVRPKGEIGRRHLMSSSIWIPRGDVMDLGGGDGMLYVGPDDQMKSSVRCWPKK